MTEEQILRDKILNHLMTHKATEQWMGENKRHQVMDIPMMIVHAMMDFKAYKESDKMPSETKDDGYCICTNSCLGSYHKDRKCRKLPN